MSCIQCDAPLPQGRRKYCTESCMTSHRNAVRLARHRGDQEDEEYRRRKAEYARGWRGRNPDKRYKKDPDQTRQSNLRSFYGMTIEEYGELERRQNGSCAVCGQPETAIGSHGETKRLSVDHDHALAVAFYLLGSFDVLTLKP